VGSYSRILGSRQTDVFKRSFAPPTTSPAIGLVRTKFTSSLLSDCSFRSRSRGRDSCRRSCFSPPAYQQPPRLDPSRTPTVFPLYCSPFPQRLVLFLFGWAFFLSLFFRVLFFFCCLFHSQHWLADKVNPRRRFSPSVQRTPGFLERPAAQNPLFRVLDAF